jgi:hypothetical protein
MTDPIALIKSRGFGIVVAEESGTAAQDGGAVKLRDMFLRRRE